MRSARKKNDPSTGGADQLGRPLYLLGCTINLTIAPYIRAITGLGSLGALQVRKCRWRSPGFQQLATSSH